MRRRRNNHLEALKAAGTILLIVLVFYAMTAWCFLTFIVGM